MKIERESSLESKFKKAVEKKGGWALKLLSVHINGLPDRIVLLPGGIIFFAELKTTKKTAEKIQEFQHRKLRKLGFKVYVIDNSQQIKDILNGF
jgi:hypothetical protein